MIMRRKWYLRSVILFLISVVTGMADGCSLSMYISGVFVENLGQQKQLKNQLQLHENITQIIKENNKKIELQRNKN